MIKEVPPTSPLVPEVTARNLCLWNFTQDKDGFYSCKNCKKDRIVQQGSGYSNLMSHMSNKSCFGITLAKRKDQAAYRQGMQPAWRAYHESTKADNKTFEPKISSRAKNIFGWIDMIVNGNNALSIVSNPLYKTYIKLDPIDRRTLRKHLIMLADIVGERIKDKIQMGNCIADGWTQTGIHYVAIYHRWPVLEKDCSIKNLTALLAMQPLLDESDLSSLSFSEFIRATYSLYKHNNQDIDSLSLDGQDMDNNELDLIVALTLDNCSTNKSTVRQLDKPMIGAHCHRLNLAASHWTKDAFGGKLQSALDKIHAVMLRASTIKNRAKIREETSYQPCIRNKTRWQGNNMMAIQYSRMHNAFQEVEIFDRVQPGDTEEIDDVINKGTKKIVPRLLLPNEKKLFDEKYLPAMIILKRWIATIQHPEINLHDSTHIFQLLRKDKNLKGHSKEFEDCLKPDHELVTSPDFEKGVVKIMNGQSEGLTVREQNECSCLLKSKWPHLYPPDEDVIRLEMVDSLGKFMKMKSAGQKRPCSDTKLDSKYVDCSFLTPTTVVVETLFSRCSRVLTADRRRMEPRLFEAIVFLRENKDWWDMELVQNMIVGQWNDRLSQYDYTPVPQGNEKDNATGEDDDFEW